MYKEDQYCATIDLIKLYIEGNGGVRGRPKLTRVEVTKRNLIICRLNEAMYSDRKKWRKNKFR